MINRRSFIQHAGGLASVSAASSVLGQKIIDSRKDLAKNEKAAKKSFDSFKKIVTKFLNVDMQFAGWLPESKAVAGSIIARKPAVLQKSLEPILKKNFTEIANNLVKTESVKSSGVKFFNKK